MTMRPAQLRFQLTPLLDLLLIVIFAQYLEVQETTHREVNAIQQETSRELADVRQQYEQADAKWKSARNEIDELRTELDDARQTARVHRAKLEDQLAAEFQQRSQLGEMVSKLFDVSSELIERAMQPITTENPLRSKEERQRLKEMLQQASQVHGPEIIKHLLTFDELNKRCDVWEIHLADNDDIHLTVNDYQTVFTARNADEFSQKLFEQYKLLPQPKSLVVILVSFGDATAVVRETVRDALPRVIERMQADSSGRTRFEYTVIGYWPQAVDRTSSPSTDANTENTP